MVLYFKLATNKWGSGDYTNSGTYDIDGTVYTDDKLSSTATLTGFTTTVRLYIVDQEGMVVYSNDTVLTLGSSGTFTIRFTNSNSPHLYGTYRARLFLADTNTGVTCVGVNGSDVIFFES